MKLTDQKVFIQETCLPEVSQDLSTVWLGVHQPLYSRSFEDGGVTPASTLVISKTLMPASGKVDDSGAIVAI